MQYISLRVFFPKNLYSIIQIAKRNNNFLGLQEAIAFID